MKTGNQKEPKPLKFYIKGTFILLVIWAIVLVSCYGIAFKGSDEARKIFFIVFFSLMGASLIAYWIYAFIRERRLKDR